MEQCQFHSYRLLKAWLYHSLVKDKSIEKLVRKDRKPEITQALSTIILSEIYLVSLLATSMKNIWVYQSYLVLDGQCRKDKKLKHFHWFIFCSNCLKTIGNNNTYMPYVSFIAISSVTYVIWLFIEVSIWHYFHKFNK